MNGRRKCGAYTQWNKKKKALAQKAKPSGKVMNDWAEQQGSLLLIIFAVNWEFCREYIKE